MRLLQSPTCWLMRNGRSAALAEAKVVVRHIVGLQRRQGPLPAPHETLWPRGYLGDVRAARISVGADA
ncbi:hypothetical protein ACFZDJ_52620 [Streptomyces sp. NPDC007896]|uniref:hypothetical protein n=1 Tax=Streptomyces sp. NPDC007896 TaxID=3364784 RepID=UPI0036E81E7B